MAKHPPATNLNDMIALISSQKLQEKLFDLNAPSLKINWAQLPKDREQRAGKLAEELNRAATSGDGVLAREVSKLTRTLNTIAIVNDGLTGDEDIREKIKYYPALSAEFDQNSAFKFDLPQVRGTSTANLVAYVNVMQNEDTPAGRNANTIWEDLVASATAALENIKHKNFKVLPPRQDYDRDYGLTKFQEYIKLLAGKAKGRDDFLVIAVPAVTEEHVRYLVKTSPENREVSKERRDERGARFELGPDDRAVAFEIYYYEHQNRIAISKLQHMDTKLVAQIFARMVLGSDLDERKHRNFSDPLQIFRTSDCLKTIVLPTEVKDKGKLWVSEMSVVVAKVEQSGENDGDIVRKVTYFNPATFTGNQSRDIFTDMDARHDPSVFPRNLREILSAEVSIILQPNAALNLKKERTFVIRISKRNYTLVNRNQIHSRPLLAFFEQLQKDWHFEGLLPEDVLREKTKTRKPHRHADDFPNL